MIERASLEQAQAWLDGLSFPVATANVEPTRAIGRALLIELRSSRALPPVDRARIAGFALRADETEGAGPYHPLPVAATRIRAGAAMPAGTDAVLPEDLIEGGCALEAAVRGENVVAAGSQLRRGALVFPAGHRLRPQDVAVLSELDIAKVVVRFGLTVGGDVPAELDDLQLALLWRDFSQWDEEADILLTTASLPGDAWEIGGVALRPGGELCALGRRGKHPVVKLPAERLAFTLAYEVLVSRLIRGQAGLGAATQAFDCTLGARIVSAIGLTDIVLVRLAEGVAMPLPGAETGGGAALARADGYLLVPATREGLAAGDDVTVHLFGA